MSDAAAAPGPAVVAPLLASPTPVLLLLPLQPRASSACTWEARRARVWLEEPSSHARLGSLRWEEEAAGSSGGVSAGSLPLHAICDVRVGKQSAATHSPAAAQLDAAQCLTLQYTVAASARPAPSASVADSSVKLYRGLRCTLHSLDIAMSPEGPSLQEWLAALLEVLQTSLHRRLLTPAAHTALVPPIPSALLFAVEGGLEVVLHSRDPTTPDLIHSTRCLLWLDLQRDGLFWSPLPAKGTDAGAGTKWVQQQHSGLALESVSNIFLGMHDSLWEAVRASAAAQSGPGGVASPDNSIVLSIHGLAAESSSVHVELHIQTMSAAAQSMLLEAIQYANDRGEAGEDKVQGVVVVTVSEESKDVLPQFYAGPLPPFVPDPSDFLPATSPTSPPWLSPTPRTSNATYPLISSALGRNPDLTAHPALRVMVEGGGLGVTMLVRTDPEDPEKVEALQSTVLYAHDHRNGRGQLRWNCTNGGAGRANLEDLTDCFMGKQDPIFSLPSCPSSLAADTCMSVATSKAAVRLRSGQSPAVLLHYTLHLSTSTPAARTALVAALQYGLEHLEMDKPEVVEEGGGVGAAVAATAETTPASAVAQRSPEALVNVAAAALAPTSAPAPAKTSAASSTSAAKKPPLTARSSSLHTRIPSGGPKSLSTIRSPPTASSPSISPRVGPEPPSPAGSARVRADLLAASRKRASLPVPSSAPKIRSTPTAPHTPVRPTSAATAAATRAKLSSSAGSSVTSPPPRTPSSSAAAAASSSASTTSTPVKKTLMERIAEQAAANKAAAAAKEKTPLSARSTLTPSASPATTASRSRMSAPLILPASKTASTRSTDATPRVPMSQTPSRLSLRASASTKTTTTAAAAATAPPSRPPLSRSSSTTATSATTATTTARGTTQAPATSPALRRAGTMLSPRRAATTAATSPKASTGSTPSPKLTPSPKHSPKHSPRLTPSSHVPPSPKLTPSPKVSPRLTPSAAVGSKLPSSPKLTPRLTPSPKLSPSPKPNPALTQSPALEPSPSPPMPVSSPAESFSPAEPEGASPDLESYTPKSEDAGVEAQIEAEAEGLLAPEELTGAQLDGEGEAAAAVAVAEVIRDEYNPEQESLDESPSTEVTQSPAPADTPVATVASVPAPVSETAAVVTPAVEDAPAAVDAPAPAAPSESQLDATAPDLTTTSASPAAVAAATAVAISESPDGMVVSLTPMDSGEPPMPVPATQEETVAEVTVAAAAATHVPADVPPTDAVPPAHVNEEQPIVEEVITSTPVDVPVESVAANDAAAIPEPEPVVATAPAAAAIDDGTAAVAAPAVTTATVAAVADPHPPPSLPSMDAAHVAADHQVLTQDDAEEDCVLVDSVGTPLQPSRSPLPQLDVTSPLEATPQPDTPVAASSLAGSTSVATSATAPATSDSDSDSIPAPVPAPTSAPIAAPAPAPAPAVPLTPRQRAIHILEAGCAFTRYTLEDPDDPTSELRRSKIFLWLNSKPRAAMRPASPRSSAVREAEQQQQQAEVAEPPSASTGSDGGALFWCPLFQPPQKVEAPTRRLEISLLIDLFLGKQHGVFVAKSELAHLPDEACFSLVASAPTDPLNPPSEDDEPEQISLHLQALDLPSYQTWMSAFGVMLAGPGGMDQMGQALQAIAPTLADAATVVEAATAELNSAQITPVTPAPAPEVVAAAPPAPPLFTDSRIPASALAAPHQDVTALPRISLPLDEDPTAAVSRPAQVVLSTVPREAECHRLLQLVDHWKNLQEKGWEGAAANMALGQWCVARMREGVRVQKFHRGGDGHPPVSERSFLSYRDGTRAGDRGSLCISHCELDESLHHRLASFNAPMIPEASLNLADILEVVLGQFGGLWQLDATNKTKAARIAHPRSASFVPLDLLESMDVEFDSITHICTWILGLKFLLMHGDKADPDDATSTGSDAAAPASSEALTVPPALRELVDECTRVAERSAKAAHWSVPLSPTPEDPSLHLLQHGAVFHLCSGSHGPVSSFPVHVYFSFESSAVDGPFGSLYWHPMAYASADIPEEGLMKSPHQRIPLESLVALLIGDLGGHSVECAAFWNAHGQQLLKLLRQQGMQQGTTPSCVTMVARDDVWQLVWQRAGQRHVTLDLWTVALGSVLARAGRSLVLEATSGPRALWLGVTGETQAQVDAQSLPVSILATGDSPLAIQARSPEYIAAAELLKKGRSFYSYYYHEDSLYAAEPVVSRQIVTLFFSDVIPPPNQCNPFLFALPDGETRFPALWVLTQEAPAPTSSNGVPPPPTELQVEDMTFDRCISMHEITDLYCGTHNGIFHTPSALAQFVPAPTAGGERFFPEDSCLTLIAAASTERAERSAMNWNLQAVDTEGLDEWLDALTLLLPVQQQEDAASMSPAELDTSEPTQPPPLSISPSPQHATSASHESLSPVSALRHGHSFLLLQPPSIGTTEVLRCCCVQLLFLGPDELRSLGMELRNPDVFPAECIPSDPDEFQGALYWRPQPTDGVENTDTHLQLADLRADQCMPLHVINDLYVGRETPLLKSEAGEGLHVDTCFSIVSDTIEWNLHSLAEGPGQAAGVIAQFLEALSKLLQTLDRGLVGQDGSPRAGAPMNGTHSRGVSLFMNNALSVDASIDMVLQTLAAPQKATDASVHAKGMALLHKHVAAAESQPPGLMSALIDRGVARQVVVSMNAFPMHEQLQSLGCGILWMLARTAENEGKLVALGALSAVLTALRVHVASVSVVQQATGALRNLCIAFAHSQSVGNAGGLDSLLACMRAHPASLPIQQHSLGTLASLAQVADLKTLIGELGGLELILDALRQFPDERALHEEGCAAIRNLAANHPANKERLRARGALEIIVASMGRFRQSRPNQLHACGALWNLTANSLSIKTQLAKAGGIPALVEAMAAHANDVDVVTESCGALRNVSSIRDVRSALADAGAIAAVVAAMQRFPSAQSLQEACCALLFHMAHSDAHAEMLVQAGGAEAMLAAIRSFKIVAVLAEDCFGALWMTTRTRSVLSRVSSADVLPLADELVSLHSSHAGVLKYARGMRAAWVAAERAQASAAAPTANDIPSPRGPRAEDSAPPAAPARELRSATVDAAMPASISA